MHYKDGKIAMMLKDNPDKSYIGFIFASGNGLILDGYTCLLLNESYNGYYRLAEVEWNLTEMSRQNKNVYLVGIFAT